MTITYDRAGRRVGTTDAAGTHTFTYDDTANGGHLTGWSVTGTGSWSNLNVTTTYSNGKRSSRATSLGGIALPTVNYTHDAASGRMASVRAGDFTATYGFDTISGTGWNTGVTYTGGPSSTRTPDALGRLGSITWKIGTMPVSSHLYTLDAMNRRTVAQRQDGSSWSYGYNPRGEVTSANKGTEPGKQFAFVYDGIGNRTSSTVSNLATPPSRPPRPITLIT